MGDRLANRHGPKIGGRGLAAICLFPRGELGPIEHNVAWAEAYPRTKCILIHPQQTWAENWGAVPIFFGGGELVPM